MDAYLGKICPYCKTEIRKGDDIVICSDCEMPHHKNCFIENQSCTTFGCSGTIKNMDGSITVMENGINNEEVTSNVARNAVVYCTRCGFKNISTSLFCVKCGNQLALLQANSSTKSAYSQAKPFYINQSAYTQPSSNNTYYQQQYIGYGFQGYNNNQLDPTMIQLIGKNANYYIIKFYEMKTQNKKTTWNWPAFLVTPWWFFYRKMYSYGTAILAIAFVIQLINNPILSFLTYGGYAIIGVFANYIYIKHLEQTTQKANAMIEPYKTQFIEKNSRNNISLTVIGAVIYIVFILIFFL